MFAIDATGLDWLGVSKESRRRFVTVTCRVCCLGGLGESVPELVLEGIDAYFSVPHLRAHKLSFAFGNIYAALLRYGYYQDHLARLTAERGGNCTVLTNG